MAYTLTYALNSDGNSYILSGYSGDKPTGEVVIPDSYDSKPVTIIGENAFYECSGLTSVTIGNSVTSIERKAFYYCSGLTSITIGNSVTSIGDFAFEYCSSLTKINMLPTTPPIIQNNTLILTLQNIYVPAQCGETYKTATNWNTYADKITEFPILDLGSLLMYNNKVKERMDADSNKNEDTYAKQNGTYPNMIVGNATNATNDGDGNKIINTYAKKAEISNPNLLINPDFSINQRGQESYTGTGYGVDRWKGYQLNVMVCTPRDGYGVTLSAPTEATGTGAIYTQPFEASQLSKLAGRTVTVSFNVSANRGTSNIYVRTMANGSNAGDTPNIGSGFGGIVSKTITLPSPLTSFEIVFRKGAGTLDVDIDWVKLEIGSSATEFIPPLIAEELPKCQRYYQRYNFANNMPLPLGVARNERIVSINFNIPKLRTTPTFATHGTVKLLNQNIKGLTLANNQYYDGVYRLFIETSGLSAGTGILIAGDTDGYYAFDAEIY